MCAEFVWYFLFFSLRVAPGKLKTVTTCSWFIRAFVAACPSCNSVSWEYICPEKKLMFLFIVFFLRTENGLTAKMEFSGMSRRTKAKIELRGVTGYWKKYISVVQNISIPRLLRFVLENTSTTILTMRASNTLPPFWSKVLKLKFLSRCHLQCSITSNSAKFNLCFRSPGHTTEFHLRR